MIKDRNSSKSIKHDYDFLKEIISHLENNDISYALQMLNDWANELKNLKRIPADTIETQDIYDGRLYIDNIINYIKTGNLITNDYNLI